MGMIDAVVVGSGPNGLAAALELARAGWSVRVIEGHSEIGGGTRTADLTLPGFRHDVCSACHPIGAASPFFRTLDLPWIHAPVCVAHPLDADRAVLLHRSLDQTAEGLGRDGKAYRALVEPFLADPEAFLGDLLSPIGRPARPLLFAKFGLSAIRSAEGLATSKFSGIEARALFAGCAAHSTLPLDRAATAAIGLVFLIAGHAKGWPMVRGGSGAIAAALAAKLRGLGGEIETGRFIRSAKDLPAAKRVLFALDPRQVASIAGDELPSALAARLREHRFGPGVFKIDWALSGPIPWKNPALAQAATIHVGGRLEEVAAAESAVWRGENPRKPFTLLCQPSLFDPSRAPEGKHVGWAYCHVPAGSTDDQTAAIESDVEKLAPGFRDRILARHTLNALEMEAYNPCYVGGAITGGVADLKELVTRSARNPYATPNPRIFLCGASTPPGGGVHGMAGYHAARAVLASAR